VDQHRFDDLTRSASRLLPRRGLLRGVAGAGLALGLTRLPEAVAAKRKKKRKKRNKGQPAPQCDVCRSGCAFTNLQQAIDAAAPEATIRLCPETYPERVYVEKNLTLVGAGADRTALDGGGALDMTSVLGVGPAVTVVVRDLTVRGGNRGAGGGVFNEGALTLERVAVTGNKAGDGAGLFNMPGASLRLFDSRVSGNESSGGGGLWVDGGTVTLTRTQVTGNKALNGSFGGGIFAHDGTIALAGSDVTGNEAIGAGSKGGGFYVFAATVTLTGSRVTGNSAAAGGGIFRSAGTITIEPGSVTGNTPNNCAGDTAVTNCTN
jgi:hypothetical protein